MTTKTVIQIVAEHLRANGYSGIRNEGACGCELDALQPCGDDFAKCEAGYKHCDPREGRGHVWAIFSTPEPPMLEAFDALED